MRRVPCAVRPSLALVVLAAALAAPAAHAQDDDEAQPFVGESIIPWDLPEDSDGQVEPNEMDVRALTELFDSLCAPPPPVETVHVGTFDAATGDFIWGPDILKIPTLDVSVQQVDVDALFDSVGIEELHVDLEPAITGLGNVALPDLLSGALAGVQPSGAQPPGATASAATAAAAAPKSKPAKGVAPGLKGKQGGEAADERLRGHPGDSGVMRTWCSAAKLSLVFDVVNRPAGHVPLVVTVDGLTVQATGDAVDVLVPPRTQHDFAVSCGKLPEFADLLTIGRPPLLGAFTLEALPVAIVYEPPGGSGCGQTWTQAHRVGTRIRTFQADGSSAAQPVDTPFSRVGDFIALLGGAGSAAASSNVPYVQQAGMAAQVASTALEKAWGHSSTTETVEHAVTAEHALTFQLSESVTVSTTEGLGPGEGDVFYLLLKPTFAWMVTESQSSHRLYVTAALLGYQGHATVSAKALRSHTLALPPVDVQDQLLGLDPMAAEYEPPTGAALGLKKHLPTGLFGGGSAVAPPRLQLLANPLVVVAGGGNTFTASRMIEAADLVETQDIRTTTTQEEGGLLSYISKDVPQTGTRTLRVLGGRSTLDTVSDEVAVSVTLTHPSADPLYLEAYYDHVFGTFAFKTFVPGGQPMSGTVSDAAGLPKPAQPVKAMLPDGRGMTTTTDGAGHFELQPPAGVKGPVIVESGTGRTQVEWDGTAKGGVVVRESAQPLAKAGGKKTKGSGKLPDPSTVPVKASEGTTATAIRGKPGPEAGGPATIVPDPSLHGRLGRMVVSFAGEADAKNSRVDVYAAASPKDSLASGYGTLSKELLPGTYAVQISGRRVDDIEVRSGHETRVRVGVLRVNASDGTRVDFFEPGTKEAFHSFYGSADVLLPPGQVEVAIAGMRDKVDVRDGEVAVF